jgi:hypothetical protein
VSIDYSKVTGLSDHIGNIVKITDASGRVIWAVSGGKVILEVEKITSDTYAGETTYTGEEFILLDIYPKTNGTVKVTYGGFTKTITDTSGAAEPNAQQVFFGTFNGVSDSVTTHESGELTIEGGCVAFGCGVYSFSSKVSRSCTCITAITDFGSAKSIPANAFGRPTGGCPKITEVDIPEGVTSIGDGAFQYCEGLQRLTIPSSVTSLGTRVIENCYQLTNIIVNDGNEYYSSDGGVLFDKNKTRLIEYPSCSGDYTIPDSVTDIGPSAFFELDATATITVPASVTDIGTRAFYKSGGAGQQQTNVVMLSTTPPTIGSAAFFASSTHYNYGTITVPKGCGDTYKNATGWSEYADIIVEAS